MNHEESKLQQQCVAWFRSEYPQYAMLLTHPINEGSGHTQTDRRRQGIHKAEGAVAGVADLLFFLSAIFFENNSSIGSEYHGLGIEFKTAKGRLSQEQMDFQKMYEAADYRYVVIRDKDSFMNTINTWIAHANVPTKNRIFNAYTDIKKAAEAKEREHFYKVIGRK